MSGQTPNKPLFSRHYLDFRLQECPEWSIDLADVFARLQTLYQGKKNLLPTLNESQTEDEFIKPVLEILGFSYIPQVTTKGKGRAERPDYALFGMETEKINAYPLQNDETAFYSRVLAIAEAKYWERSLSDVSKNDKRDIFKNSNPSFQITNYLTGTGVDWGILTNGREWRLYYRQASSTATEFYPVDLIELLEAGDLERFKYFWLFFRKEAFVRDVHAKNFLERVREGSTTYATRVGNELKELVFDRIFPEIAGGFVAFGTDSGEDLLYSASLSLLYKLLFLLYAEARNLLPVTGDYRDYSLRQKTREIAEKIDRQQVFSRASTQLYDAFLNLFRIIDKGDPSLSVPRYNGGLFDMEEGEVNRFLGRYKLSDAILAPVLDRLARFEGQPIDYSFLGVRQLGSIYEGLLEYRLVIDGESVHLENDKGERKATGSYYTPDYIVKYIVRHTLKPILEERTERFAELMGKMSDVRRQLADKRLGKDSQRGLERELQGLERESIATLLDLKLCDPAMGSGHFLVEAVDYLTDELIRILNRYPEDENPVLQMLEETRRSILENLRQQGIILDSHTLEPTQLLQRVVMKRCIYGVDLNPMAVELAKVSLWLHSFTIGAPLSFLDHHLRCGNSLIGTTAREAEASMIQEESGQFSLLTGPFVGLLRAAEIMRGISTLSDATFAEVEQSERLFRAFDEEAKPYKRLLDVFVSRFFGVKSALGFLQRYGGNVSGVNWEKLPKSDREILTEASSLYTSKRFFHWDLEFPEVFIDLESATWKENAGFDAVIGNPPYLSTAGISPFDREYFKDNYTTSGKELNTFSLFIEKCLKSLFSFGTISFIVPDSLLNVQSYVLLRSYILDTCRVLRLAEIIGGAFDEAIVGNSLLFVFEKERERDKRDGNSVIIDHFTSTNLYYQAGTIPQKSYHELSDRKIFYTEERAIYFLNRTCDFSKLESLTEIKDGIKTGNNNNFVTNFPNGSQYKKLLSGSDIERYSYQYKGNFVLYDRSALARPREEYIFTSCPKIIIRQTGDQLIGTVDDRQFYTLDNTHIILLKYKELSCYYMIAIINSKFLDFIHKIIAGEEGRVYAQVRISNLEQLPIPEIKFTTPIERRQQCLETLEDLYQNNRPLLPQIEDHIQREETDIIHDFLAYLAERMIEINREKQTEIKGFLQYLERLIGGSIELLTNKSRIQNYLGDYQKQEPHLSLEDLLEILKKNRKKLSVNPLDRTLQENLENEYRSSLEKLLPLKEKLTETDALIDAIVYKLYGLTEEEIQIIEGKT